MTGPVHQLVTATDGTTLSHPAVAMNPDGGFVLTWQETDQNGNTSIMARVFNADGTDAGADLVIAEANGLYSPINPAVAVDGQGNFLVAWQDGMDGYYGISGETFTIDGMPTSDVMTLVDGSPEENLGAIATYDPAVAMNADGSFVVAWEQITSTAVYRQDIMARRFDSAGNRQGADLIVAGGDDSQQPLYVAKPTLAVDGNGNFLVAWQEYVADPDEGFRLFGQAFNADSVPLTGRMGLLEGDHDTVAPVLAMDSAGDFLLAWQQYTDNNGWNLQARSGGLDLSAPTLPGDANGDGKVDVIDLGVLATNYDLAATGVGQGDFNGDGKVDVIDLGILATNYDQTLTAPTVTVNAQTTGDASPELTGTVSDPDAAIGVTVDGRVYSAQNNGDGTWVLAEGSIYPLAAGTYDVAVTAADGLIGKDATTNELTTIDVTPPVVTVYLQTHSISTPMIYGTVDDPTATILVVVNGHSYTGVNDGFGTWSAQITHSLAPGVYDVVIVATDPAGNVGTDTTTNELTIKTTPPILTITGGDTSHISGHEDEMTTVWVALFYTSGSQYTGWFGVNPDSGGNWTVNFKSIPAGTYIIKAEATDWDNNRGTAQATLTLTPAGGAAGADLVDLIAQSGPDSSAAQGSALDSPLLRLEADVDLLAVL
jgi:hypothetical protein